MGSELLYDGLPASSLDRQPLAAAITAHLAHPAIPAAGGLLAGLCAAAGLCVGRAGHALREQIGALRAQAVAVQSAVVRSREILACDARWAASGLPPATPRDVQLETTYSLQTSRTAAVSG